MKDMSPEEYDWQVKLVQDRYSRYKISYEQAEKVFRFENQNRIYSYEHSFTDWEEWDYEYYFFQQILNSRQFSIYKNEFATRIRRHEKSLKEHDKQNTDLIEYEQGIVDYYRNKFWPDLYKDQFIFPYPELDYLKIQRDYLKAAYKNYLNDLRVQMISQHFREYKQTQPNKLKCTILRLENYHLWPNFYLFEESLDEPGKAIADYLGKKITQFPPETEKLVTKKTTESKFFFEKLHKKYIENTKKGYAIIIGKEMSEKEQKRYLIMTLILGDKDEYGWRNLFQ